jgi:hypothetical protein
MQKLYDDKIRANGSNKKEEYMEYLSNLEIPNNNTPGRVQNNFMNKPVNPFTHDNSISDDDRNIFIGKRQNPFDMFPNYNKKKNLKKKFSRFQKINDSNLSNNISIFSKKSKNGFESRLSNASKDQTECIFMGNDSNSKFSTSKYKLNLEYEI